MPKPPSSRLASVGIETLARSTYTIALIKARAAHRRPEDAQAAALIATAGTVRRVTGRNIPLESLITMITP